MDYSHSVFRRVNGPNTLKFYIANSATLNEKDQLHSLVSYMSVVCFRSINKIVIGIG